MQKQYLTSFGGTINPSKLRFYFISSRNLNASWLYKIKSYTNQIKNLLSQDLSKKKIKWNDKKWHL